MKNSNSTSLLEKLLLKLCLFTLKNSITNHNFIHNHETHNLNKKFVHNYHKLSRVFTQAYLPPSAFSNPTPAVKEATGLKQVHTVNIGLNGFNYIFLRKLDISQLQSGSNLITFIQYCTQVYKPCLKMLMFPMMFTRGFATVIYFIWKTLRCNGDEQHHKTL